MPRKPKSKIKVTQQPIYQEMTTLAYKIARTVRSHRLITNTETRTRYVFFDRVLVDINKAERYIKFYNISTNQDQYYYDASGKQIQYHPYITSDGTVDLDKLETVVTYYLSETSLTLLKKDEFFKSIPMSIMHEIESSINPSLRRKSNLSEYQTSEDKEALDNKGDGIWQNTIAEFAYERMSGICSGITKRVMNIAYNKKLSELIKIMRGLTAKDNFDINIEKFALQLAGHEANGTHYNYVWQNFEGLTELYRTNPGIASLFVRAYGTVNPDQLKDLSAPEVVTLVKKQLPTISPKAWKMLSQLTPRKVHYVLENFYLFSTDVVARVSAFEHLELMSQVKEECSLTAWKLACRSLSAMVSDRLLPFGGSQGDIIYLLRALFRESMKKRKRLTAKQLKFIETKAIRQYDEFYPKHKEDAGKQEERDRYIRNIIANDKIASAPMRLLAARFRRICDWFNMSGNTLDHNGRNHFSYFRKQAETWHRVGNYTNLYADKVWPTLVETAESDNNKYRAKSLHTGKDLIKEGEDLHHCVAGYAKYCIQGKSRIFSIREVDGSNAATLEIRILTSGVWYKSQCQSYANGAINPAIDQLANKIVQIYNEKFEKLTPEEKMQHFNNCSVQNIERIKEVGEALGIEIDFITVPPRVDNDVVEYPAALAAYIGDFQDEYLGDIPF